MKTKLTSYVRVLSLVLLGALLPGCEDSGVIAPSDGSIVLTANPSRVILDLTTFEGTSTITAMVLDKGGTPQQNIVLQYSASGGKIVSAADGTTEIQSAKTNSSGIALVKLLISGIDPDSIDVTVITSTLLKTVTVANLGACPDSVNTAPIATIAPPATITLNVGTGGSGTVTLNGIPSRDPEGLPIDDYQWSCGGNGIPPVQSGDDSVAECTYQLPAGSNGPQTFTATLIVTDKGTGPPARLCQKPSAAASVSITIRQ